jgi:hypothetical protein
LQRTFDLTWHTLFGDRGRPVRYCPAPAVRASHLGDLVQPGSQRLRFCRGRATSSGRARGDTAQDCDGRLLVDLMRTHRRVLINNAILESPYLEPPDQHRDRRDS